MEFDNAIRTLPRSISLSLGRDLNLTLLIVRIVCAPVSEHLHLHDLIGGITPQADAVSLPTRFDPGTQRLVVEGPCVLCWSSSIKLADY